MKMPTVIVVGAFLLASSASFALALPGESFSVVKQRMSAKRFTLRCPISDMSGAPFCTVTGKVDGGKFIYNFSDDVGHIDYQETLRYDAPGFSFLAQNDSRVRALLTTVLGIGVAQDFVAAKRVANVAVYHSKARAIFLRGAQFGYVSGELGTNDLRFFRVSDLAKEIANAKKCTTMECGD